MTMLKLTFSPITAGILQMNHMTDQLPALLDALHLNITMDALGAVGATVNQHATKGSVTNGSSNESLKLLLPGQLTSLKEIVYLSDYQLLNNTAVITINTDV